LLPHGWAFSPVSGQSTFAETPPRFAVLTKAVCSLSQWTLVRPLSGSCSTYDMWIIPGSTLLERETSLVSGVIDDFLGIRDPPQMVNHLIALAQGINLHLHLQSIFRDQGLVK
jgi:hypothetical protein